MNCWIPASQPWIRAAINQNTISRTTASQKSKYGYGSDAAVYMPAVIVRYQPLEGYQSRLHHRHWQWTASGWERTITVDM